MGIRWNNLYKSLAVFLGDSAQRMSAIIRGVLWVSHALERRAGHLWSPLPRAIRISPVQAPEFTNGLCHSPARFQSQ